MPITNSISRTALLTAAARARESRRSDPLFVDPFAEALAGPDGFSLMDRLEATSRPPGASGQPENPYIAIRTRMVDDFVLGELARGDVAQVVMLGAGLDSRAFRLPIHGAIRWFELDRPEVLQSKQEILDGLGARPKCARRAIGVDLSQPWGESLVEAGFDATAPSVWLIEGLLPYLDPSEVDSVLVLASNIAAPGSRMFADLPGRSFLESPWTRAYTQALAREGAPWKFGTDDPEGLFEPHGWRVRVQRPGEEGASWGRWPYRLPPRSDREFPQSYWVTGVRTSGRST